MAKKVVIKGVPKIDGILYGYPIGKPCEVTDEEYKLFLKAGILETSTEESESAPIVEKQTKKKA